MHALRTVPLVVCNFEVLCTCVRLGLSTTQSPFTSTSCYLSEGVQIDGVIGASNEVDKRMGDRYGFSSSFVSCSHERPIG